MGKAAMLQRGTEPLVTIASSARRVAFLLPDMRGGGAERLTIDLMAGMLARGHAVDLVLQRTTGEFLALVPQGVRLVGLDAPRIRQAFNPLRQYLRTERPDSLIAAMWPLTVAAILANRLAGSPSRVIVSDHGALLSQYGDSRRTLIALRASIRLTYSLADARVGVSQGLAEDLSRLAGLPADQVAAIYNPVPMPLRSDRAANDLWQGRPGKRVLSIGNLKRQKNHALLLSAFDRLAASREAVLAIVGTGPLEDELRAEAGRRGLADRVLFPGFTPTPGDWYAGADLFVLSSDYEGFGNVLVEAMHYGLPVVSTDCPFGPSEILGAGSHGALVAKGDADALAAAMALALEAPRRDDRQRARAVEFSVERAVAGYAALVEQA